MSVSINNVQRRSALHLNLVLLLLLLLLLSCDCCYPLHLMSGSELGVVRTVWGCHVRRQGLHMLLSIDLCRHVVWYRHTSERRFHSLQLLGSVQTTGVDVGMNIGRRSGEVRGIAVHGKLEVVNHRHVCVLILGFGVCQRDGEGCQRAPQVNDGLSLRCHV